MCGAAARPPQLSVCLLVNHPSPASRKIDITVRWSQITLWYRSWLQRSFADSELHRTRTSRKFIDSRKPILSLHITVMLQQQVTLGDSDDFMNDSSYWDEAQSISGNNIDPAKLTMLLRIKFGAGAYNFHVSPVERS